MQNIQPIEGWVLDYITALDEYHPGTAGAYLRASAERRQVVAALLSVVTFPIVADEAAELARFVSTADHRSLLLRAFGDVPVGLRGSLGRSGHQPHGTSFYRSLFQAMRRNGHVANALRRLDKVAPDKLHIAKNLPPAFCTPKLVTLLASPQMARDVAIMLEILKDHGVNEDALRRALETVTCVEQLPAFWERWAGKCPFPDHPVQASEVFRPVLNGEDLTRLARKYQNCSRRYLFKALAGKDAFTEFVQPSGSIVVHMKKVCENWVVEGMFGIANQPVPPRVRLAAFRHLRDIGVTDGSTRRANSPDWSALRRLTSRHLFDLTLDL